MFAAAPRGAQHRTAVSAVFAARAARTEAEAKRACAASGARAAEAHARLSEQRAATAEARASAMESTAESMTIRGRLAVSKADNRERALASKLRALNAALEQVTGSVFSFLVYVFAVLEQATGR